MQAVSSADAESAALCRKGAYIFGVIAAGYLCFINIMNNVTFRINVSYLKEQLSEGKCSVVLIDEPYARYTPAFSFNKFLEEIQAYSSGVKKDYIICLMRYHGIPEEQIDPDTLHVTRFSLYDYLV